MSSLDEQSLKRKNRLQQLRDRKKKQAVTSASSQGEVPTATTSLSLDSIKKNDFDQQLQQQHLQQEPHDNESQHYNDLDNNNADENDNNIGNGSNTNNINVITTTLQPAKNTTTTKPTRRTLISRNYDRETNLPKNAFTSESLRMELENGQMVELVSEAQQGEILSRLSKKYDLGKDDEEEENAGDIENDDDPNNDDDNYNSTLGKVGKIGKVRAILDFEEELQDQEKLLDRRTNKMIRQLLRERLHEMNKSS